MFNMSKFDHAYSKLWSGTYLDATLHSKSWSIHKSIIPHLHMFPWAHCQGFIPKNCWSIPQRVKPESWKCSSFMPSENSYSCKYFKERAPHFLDIFISSLHVAVLCLKMNFSFKIFLYICEYELIQVHQSNGLEDELVLETMSNGYLIKVVVELKFWVLDFLRLPTNSYLRNEATVATRELCTQYAIKGRDWLRKG